MTKFPVWQTVADSFDYIWRERRALVRFGTLPFVVTLVLFVVVQASGFKSGRMDFTSQGVIFISGLVQMAIYLPLSVTWYRLVVHGETGVSQRPVFTLGRSEGRFLLWQFIILLVAALIIALAAAIIGAVFYVLRASVGELSAVLVSAFFCIGAVLVFLVILNRLGMVFVLAALDQPVSLKASWRMTEGLGWPLVGAIALIVLASVIATLGVQLIAFVLGAVIAMAGGTSLRTVVPYIVMAGSSVITVLIMLAMATVFGFAYRMLMASRPELAAAPVAP